MSGTILQLPLCPSTNARMGVVRMGRFCRQLLTKEARDYIRTVGIELKLWAKKRNWETIKEFTEVGVWVVMPRTNCDGHNYGKILWDTLEAGGIFENDKFIMPHYRGYWWDAKNTMIVVKIQDTK